MNKKLLYYAGMVSVISYVLVDIVGGIITPGFSYIANAVSELSQAGAENRIFFSLFLFIHSIMGILFAIGLILHHPYNKAKIVFIGGILYIVMGINNALSGTIFPMDPIGAETTFDGKMHLILVGTNVVLTFPLLPMIGQGLYKYKNWKSFRTFTFICLSIMFIFGALTPYIIANRIELMGLTERFVAYTLDFALC